MRIRIDKGLCTGCEGCNYVCSYRHTGTFNLKSGCIKFHGDMMYAGKMDVCMQCKNARCVAACPVGAISQGEDTVELDRTACIGCGACVEACPFHAIFLDGMDGLARKCDLCGGDPTCIKYCQKQAISLVK